MSVSVRPAGAADIDGVCDLLHRHTSAKISREHWRGLLDYPWRPADADRGMLAVDGEQIVGFLGLIYADRRIGKNIRRFCNICAWYLLKDYRGRGIGQEMQRLAIADTSLTYTLVTATAATSRAFRRSGLQVLDGERYLLRQRGDTRGGLDIVEGADAVEPLIGQGDRLILGHHRDFRLNHVLVKADAGQCYLIVQVSLQGDDIAYHQVLYASDAIVLHAHAQAIADRVLGNAASVLAIDRRFVAEPSDAAVETLRQPRLYRSPDVPPAAIDHLYNEIVLLDLKLP